VGAHAGLTHFSASWFATRCTLMRKDGDAETRIGFGLYESIFEKLSVIYRTKEDIQLQYLAQVVDSNIDSSIL
jgi:hypothetical protein